MADEMQNGNADVQQAVTAALEEQKKKKKKKRLIIFGVILAVILVIGIAGSGSEGNNSATVSGGTENGGTASSENASSVQNAEKSENNVGKYKVEMKNSRITTNTSGEKILVVTYSFTNNASEAKSFDYAIDAKAFQNGIALGDVFTSYGIDGYSFDEQHKEVKPGNSLDVQYAYELNDTKSNIEIELSQWLSDKVEQKYTISINK